MGFNPAALISGLAVGLVVSSTVQLRRRAAADPRRGGHGEAGGAAGLKAGSRRAAPRRGDGRQWRGATRLAQARVVDIEATSRHSARRGRVVRLLSIEPRRLRSIRERPKAYRFAVGAVCIGAFMGQLDASIVTLAFPSLEHAFHAGIGAVTWVGLSYLVTLVALVTVVGRFADMAGRKLLYVYGFGVFVLGSAACGLAPDLAALDGFRVAQGVGAAMLQANSLAIINLAVPRAALPRAIGVQGAAQALGLALGPSVGGALIAAGGWRLIFLVNVPVGVVGVATGLAFIPRSRHLRERVPLDWTGLALFVPAVAALLVAISVGERWGWGSGGVVALLCAGAAASVGFLARERRARHPMLDLGLFRRRAFSCGVASALLAYLVTFGVLLVAPYLFERALALGPGAAGLDVMAMPLALGVVALVAGHLAGRVGLRALTTLGLVLVAAALGVLAIATPTVGRLVGGARRGRCRFRPVHPGEQRLDPVGGAPGAVRRGVRRRQRDPRDRHGARAGAQRARLRPRRGRRADGFRRRRRLPRRRRVPGGGGRRGGVPRLGPRERAPAAVPAEAGPTSS